jgi:CheY-like chemotaxis protein
MLLHRQLILVAEDQTLIRLEAVEILTAHGYEVIEASGADEALSVLEARATEIRILFTDIQMPGSMDGLELACQVRRGCPWIAILIASGRDRPLPVNMPDGSHFLSKAYDPKHMAAEIRNLTAGR